MLAAQIDQTGPPDVIQIREVAAPVAGVGEVLVQVRAAALNPIDTYVRSGAMATMIGQYPYTPGCDLAGVVVAVGAGTRRFHLGDRVWGSNQGLFGRQGACAQLRAIHEDWLYPMPDGQAFDAAAAGALVGITAHLGLFANGSLKAGETVFVNGGSGGVGTSVIQLAKAAGARVVATAGSEPKRELCRQLGATVVLDYAASNFNEELSAEAGAGFDIWFDTQREPNFDLMVSLLKARGRIVLMAGRGARPQFPVGPFYAKDLKMLGFAMFNATPDEQRECAAALNALASAGQWQAPIGARFPLRELAAAHALQEANTIHLAGTLQGKIVIEMPE